MAPGVAQVSGGGGTSNDMPWRDKDEDFLDWARRAMRYAHAKHYPVNRLKQSLSKYSSRAYVYIKEQVFPNWKHLFLIGHLSEGIQIFLIVSDKRSCYLSSISF